MRESVCEREREREREKGRERETHLTYTHDKTLSHTLSLSVSVSCMVNDSYYVRMVLSLGLIYHTHMTELWGGFG